MMYSTDNRWSALYYPYSDVRQIGGFLKACLYFDQVYILAPYFFISPSSKPGQGESGFFNRQSNPEIKILHDEEVLKDVDPNFLGIESTWLPGFKAAVYDEEVRPILTESIARDLADPNLRKLAEKHGKLFWRFPNLQFIGISALGLLFDTTRNLQRNIGVEYWCESMYHEYLGDMQKHITMKEFSEDRGPFEDREMVVVPYILGEALMINIALLACSKIGLTPYTDSPDHDEFLKTKMQSIKISDEYAALASKTVPVGRKARAQRLSQFIFESSLVDIDGLTAEKVLRIRERRAEELERFRMHMKALATKLENQVWDVAFEAEVQDVIDRDIRPAVDALQSSISSLRKELGIRIAKSLITAAPLSLVATLTTGLPIEVGLALSAGVGATLELVESWRKAGAARANGLSYLLSVSK